MPSLSVPSLLDVWAHAAVATAPARRRELLRAACPETPEAQLASLTVGEGDRRLLLLREMLFGQQFTAVSECPQCHELVELLFDSLDLRAGTTELPTAETHSLDCAECQITFRLPTGDDLETISQLSDPATARAALMERCVVSADVEGRPVSFSSLPDHALAALSERMEQCDPQADARVELTCPMCRHRWISTFDIAAYLWDELHAWATQLLREVHTLARAYGWTESEVLALPAYRRRCYLEMLAG